MILDKVLENNPVSWYITQYDQKSPVKKAGLIEVVRFKGQYHNVSKKEMAEIEPYVDSVDNLYAGLPVTVTRTRKYNLATIYYVGSLHDGVIPTVVDIHYHRNGWLNGRRSEKELRKAVDDMLLSFAYQKNLIIGAYDCNKKRVFKDGKRKHTKKYVKIS